MRQLSQYPNNACYCLIAALCLFCVVGIIMDMANHFQHMPYLVRVCICLCVSLSVCLFNKSFHMKTHCTAWYMWCYLLKMCFSSTNFYWGILQIGKMHKGVNIAVYTAFHIVAKCWTLLFFIWVQSPILGLVHNIKSFVEVGGVASWCVVIATQQTAFNQNFTPPLCIYYALVVINRTNMFLQTSYNIPCHINFFKFNIALH